MDIDHTLTGRGRGGEGRGNVIGERGRAGAETCATHTAQAEIRFVVNLVL